MRQQLPLQRVPRPKSATRSQVRIPVEFPAQLTDRPATASQVRVRTHTIGRVVVLQVASSLSDVAHDLDQTIQLALADEPRGVVCDLSALRKGFEMGAVEVLASSGRHVRDWPGIPVAVACPAPRIRSALAAHPLTLGGKLVGRFSVDEESQLHGFYVSDELESLATKLFVRVLKEMNISAAMASTVDPTFLSLSLTAGGVAHPVALMYDHIAGPESDESVGVRIATSTEHLAAVAFYQAETGSPEAFLTRFLAERIDLHELYLVAADGRVVATGECRAARLLVTSASVDPA